MKTHKSFLELVNIPTIPVRLRVPAQLNFPANTAPVQSEMSVFNAMPTPDVLGVLKERSDDFSNIVSHIEFNTNKNNPELLKEAVVVAMKTADDLKNQCQQILASLDDGVTGEIPAPDSVSPTTPFTEPIPSPFPPVS